MKRKLVIGIIVLFGIGIFRVPMLHAVTASYNSTVRIVDSSGNVINGVASAVTALYNQTVRVVDSNGKVIDSFGSGTTITSGAGDFGSATAQSGAVLTGVVASVTQPLTTVLNAASPYTILSTDKRILCAISGGAISLNLPAATGSQRQIVIQTDGVAACTVVHNGSDTINGTAANVLISGTGTTATFVDYVSGKWSATEGISNATTTQGGLLLFGGGGSVMVAGNSSNGLSVAGPVSTATSPITSTTGAIGPTGGGVLQSYGGTVPTLTGGCNGSGASAVVGTNTAGHFTTQTAGATTCTLTFSASGAFHAAPDCMFYDDNADATPVAFSTGAVSTTTVVTDFTSLTATQVGYICIGH